MRPSLKGKKPSKLSIANGFVIGEVPIIKCVDNNGNVQELDIKNDITEVMRALLSPRWTHGYVLGYSEGKHKSIMGHYQFFEMDQTKLGTAINHILHNEKKQHVFFILSGCMTPSQEKLVKNIALLIPFSTVHYLIGSLKSQDILVLKMCQFRSTALSQLLLKIQKVRTILMP